MSGAIAELTNESVRGGFFLFAGNALSTFVLAIGSIVIARLLGPENYGLYSISIVAPSVFLLFTGFGVDAAMTRYSAKLRSEGRTQLAAGMLRSGMVFKLLTAVIMFIACFILSEGFAANVLNRPGIGDLIRLSALLIMFQAIFSTTSSAFIARAARGARQKVLV